MDQLDLIESLRKDAGISKSEAAEVIKIFFSEMASTLAAGGRVEIRGLCSFYIKKYKAYKGRNPKTGEIVKVPAKKLPLFKCGKELRDRVNHNGKAG